MHTFASKKIPIYLFEDCSSFLTSGGDAEGLAMSGLFDVEAKKVQK